MMNCPPTCPPRTSVSFPLTGLIREFGEGHGVVYVDDARDVVPMALKLAEGGDIMRLGSSARDLVSKNDWETVADEFERLLDALIRTRQPPVVLRPGAPTA